MNNSYDYELEITTTTPFNAVAIAIVSIPNTMTFFLPSFLRYIPIIGEKMKSDTS